MAVPHKGYGEPRGAEVDRVFYNQLSVSGNGNIVRSLTVPKRDGRAWEMKAGQTCRIICSYGSQVGDVNFWNLHDPREHFYTGKTRQIHRSHLSLYDRLWSCLPYLRPMATITQDSLQYGVDNDGMGVHDVIGTRCDPYTHKLINGEAVVDSCHQNLTRSVKAYGLQESDVHDVFNIFMCSGFHKDTHEYIIKSSPAKKGDYIEFVAEMDLLVALSACPYGDVSIQCGQNVPDEKCFGLDVVIGQPEESLLKRFNETKTAELD